MSKTALIGALEKFDLETVQKILKVKPELKKLRPDKDLNLLQFTCRRFTGNDGAKANRQLRLAKWLVSEGFDPLAMYATEPEEGEEECGHVSLTWFAVAKAQNTKLARYFLQQGARGGALFAAGETPTSSPICCGMETTSTRLLERHRFTWRSTCSTAE